MAKKQLPSLTRIKELLRESAIDPRNDSPISIIVETAVSNPRYSETRAIEFIKEAQQALDSPASSPVQAAENLETYHYKLKTAISLLAVSRAVRE